jgi:Ca2+-binding RTX toxin-like protein
MAFGAAPAGAAETPPESEPTLAEVAAELPTPTCAEGPQRDGEVIVGTDCADTIVVPPTVTYVNGGPGNDVIVGSQTGAVTPCPEGCHLEVGSQTFEGGEGDDLVYGDRGNDILRGNGGDDRLYGGIGDDRLEGGAGNDWLSGGFGADTIDGGEGSDYVRGDATIDHIFDTGLAGTDTLSFATAVTPGFTGTANPTGATNFPGPEGERGIYLHLGDAGANAIDNEPSLGGGNDEVQQGAFERIIGTPFADYIVGTSAKEEILGGGGADVIEGGGGDDVLRGGADGDYLEDGAGAVLDGEAGTDGCSQTGAQRVECETTAKAVEPRNGARVSVGEVTAEPLGIGGATGSVDVYLAGSSGNDTVTATYGAGVVEFALGGSAKFDTAPADAGGCTLGPGAEPTTATCPLGAPTTPNVPPLDAILLAGLAGNDTINAPNFPDGTSVVELGGEGDDTLNGGPSEDVLVDGPGTGADTLNAGAGDDALLHNGGKDVLEGGPGSDLFLSVSVCDGERIVGGIGGPNDRDNASWARLGGGGVYANLSTGVAGRVAGESPSCPSESFDHLEGISDLEGSEGNDVLIGNESSNQLLGHTGADIYRAMGGEDTVFANSGSRDLAIDCGEGTDAAVIDFAATIGDPAPVGCESVREAKPNEYRTQVEEPPPTEEPPPPAEPPPVEPPPPGGTTGGGPTGTTNSPGTGAAGTGQSGSVKPGAGSGTAGVSTSKLDRTPPRTKLLGHQAKTFLAARGKRAAVAIRFAASERSHFECKLDGRAFHSCHSPLRARLSVGRHTFRVYAIDAAGNRDRTPALVHLRVVAARPR